MRRATPEKPPVRIHYSRAMKATDKAVCFLIGDRSIWIPRSLILDSDQVAKTIEVAGWFADKEDLA